MKGIFISYRREDSAGYAGRLYDRLAAHFGADRVFMDVEGIEPGVDFVDAIERAVGSCEVLIVIIGRDWLAADASGQRRLDDPNDFVRIETVAALGRGIRVVPVLVDDAPMPRADQLPPDLAPLARRQAVELSHKQWDATSAELVRTLEKVLDADKPKRAAAAPEPARAPHAEVEAVAPSPGAARAGSNARVIVAAVAGFAALAAVALYYVLKPAQTEIAGEPPARVADSAARPAEKTPASPSSIEPAPERKPEPAASPPERKSEAAAPERKPEPAASPPERKSEASAFAPSPERKPEPAAPVPSSERKSEPAAPAAQRKAEVPAPKPKSDAPSPERKAEVAAAPPKILNFESRVGDGRAVLCYGVENATSATISPAPGSVKPVGKECVRVPADASRTYTLAARNAAGAVVTRSLTVDVPAPAPPPRLAEVPSTIGKARQDAIAAVEGAGFTVRIVEEGLDPKATGRADTVVAQLPRAGEALGPGGRVTLQVMPASKPASAVAANPAYPSVGDFWEYRHRSVWKTFEPRAYSHRVSEVSQGEIREYMRNPASPDKSSERKSFAANTRFVEWRGTGYYYVEFNPFLLAFGTLQPKTEWKGIPTPIEDPSIADWYTSGRAMEWESVSVPAGTFKALRVEINSNRRVTASGAGRNEPTRIQYLVWYAPEVKRTVKHVRTVWATGGARIDEDTLELVKYRVQ